MGDGKKTGGEERMWEDRKSDGWQAQAQGGFGCNGEERGDDGIWDNARAEAFLQKARTRGCVMGLSGMRKLMEKLGNVQDTLPIVHIAGTNGKGSVGAMLESVLCEAGYHVCRYSSPAVFCPEECYRADGENISYDERMRLFEPIAAACQEMESEGWPHPTIFEVETAAAFLWFAKRGCDVALLETGMGGTLDATNVVKRPLLSVLTPISMDHMDFLGKSLADIAGAKAGIIKEGALAVTAAQPPEALEVLERACRERHARLIRASMPRHVRHEGSPASLVFDLDGIGEIRLSLLGSYQAENAACAVAAIEGLCGHDGLREREELSGRGQVALEDASDGAGRCAEGLRGHNGLRGYEGLRERGQGVSENALDGAGRCTEGLCGQGFAVSRDALLCGLAKAHWPGRFEVLCQDPLVVIDGAHNEAAAKKLRETLEMGFTNREIIYIIGVFADKEYEKMLEVMMPLAWKAYTVTPDHPRALDGQKLCEVARRYHSEVSYAGTVAEAARLAWADAMGGEGRMVLAFGSLSWLADMKKETEIMRSHGGQGKG